MSLVALKGPYWVTVRQHRRAVWSALAAALASLAVIGGLRLWDLQVPDVLAEGGYLTAAPDNRGFRTLIWAMEYFSAGMVGLPLLVAAFAAGPLVARELESGTYRLAWTQNVSPARWLRSKLLVTTGIAVLGTLALMGVFGIGHARMGLRADMQWPDRGPYEATGIVLLADVLLAVAVGALLGLLIRRTVLAMAAAGGVMGVVLLVLGALRWDFLPVRTLTGPMNLQTGPLLIPEDGFMMDMGLLTADGRRITEWSCYDGGTAEACLAAKGVTGQYVDYHPASHFWPTQFIESGILLALAAVTAYAAFRVLRSRLP